MKKNLLLIIGLTFFAFYSHAQISKGSLYIGGSFNWNNTDQERANNNIEKTNSFSFNPAIGIAVKENLIAGILLNYGKQKTEQRSGTNVSAGNSKTLGGGVFIRRYFPLANKLFVFGQADALYKNNDMDQTFSSGGGSSPFVKTKGWEAQINLTPGLSYNLFRSLHLETSFSNLLGFVYRKETRTETGFGGPIITKSKGASVYSNLSSSNFLNVGIRFIIPKKK